jgi:hypothetical protein
MSVESTRLARGPLDAATYLEHCLLARACRADPQARRRGERRADQDNDSFLRAAAEYDERSEQAEGESNPTINKA